MKLNAIKVPIKAVNQNHTHAVTINPASRAASFVFKEVATILYVNNETATNKRLAPVWIGIPVENVQNEYINMEIPIKKKTKVNFASKGL